MCLPAFKRAVATDRTPPRNPWSATWPSTRTTSDDASTPEPESVSARRAGLPRATLFAIRRTDGGVVSSIQNRNVNAPGRAPAARVEHEVVDAGCRQHRADDGLGPAEVRVRVQVDGQPRVADETVLVTVAYEPRLDVDSGAVGDHRHAEVRHRLLEHEAEDLLRPAEVDRDRPVVGVAVRRDERRLAGGVAVVDARRE